MAKALTASSIEKLRPAGARREIPDGLLAGLYLVIQPSGAKSWAVRYRFAGQPRKLTLGSVPAIDLSSARQLARRALITVAEGRDPCQEKKAAKRSSVARSQDRFDKIADDFIERYAKANTRESTWRETERLLRKDVVPAWKGRGIREITRRDVIELLDSKVDAGSPIMANRLLAAVRRLFGWCTERGIIEASPCMGVKAPAANVAVTGFSLMRNFGWSGTPARRSAGHSGRSPSCSFCQRSGVTKSARWFGQSWILTPDFGQFPESALKTISLTKSH